MGCSEEVWPSEWGWRIKGKTHSTDNRQKLKLLPEVLRLTEDIDCNYSKYQYV